MKTLMRSLILAVAVALLVGAPTSAQTYNTTTTLGAAITSYTATTIQVASSSGFAVGYGLYIDNEYMIVTRVNSSTLVSVTRSARPALHTASSVVIWGPPSMFQTDDVDGQGHPTAGACTATRYPALPIVNINNGNVWLCRAFGTAAPSTATQWVATNVKLVTYNSLLTKLP